MEDSHSLPLHDFHVHKLRAVLNRTYALFHFIALSTIFYYRGAYFFNKNDPNYYMIPFLPWLLVFAGELVFSFLWILKQPAYWKPVTRTVFPENLPKDEELPGIDIFICTADPNREPTLEVMNTVISAMALDYPADKLSVYLSDDGGASVTLEGIKEAWVFATWWLPFCKRYNVKPMCPQAYFQKPEEESQSRGEFIEDRKIIKEKFEVFKQRVQGNRGSDDKMKAQDHPALIQVIDGNSINNDGARITLNPEQVRMPLLVYLAREKRPSHPHNFKAGAINTLLRVSSTLSNSPYILTLDCDMYCNDSTSARQAMCFHLDPKISPSLGWVQFPQKFHNVTENDIYDSQMRLIWPIYWPGVDGLQGPGICGTNFYIKRETLYDTNNIHDGRNLRELKDSFGPSNEFIKSLGEIYKPNSVKAREISSVLLQEAQFLASSNYEKGTTWGDKVGFKYGTMMEDVLTSFYLQSKGWRSVYLNPPRPQFLGSANISLNETFTQGAIRYYSGLLGIGLSKHCPLIYHPSRMQFLQKMFHSWLVLYSLDFLPVLSFAIVPPLCFLYGFPLYPKVSDPFFIPFAFAFISSRIKLLCEVLISGGSLGVWLNDQRIVNMKAITCYAYGALYCAMTKLGLREPSFVPTNKVEDEDKDKYYKMDKYDFRTSDAFLVPFVAIVTLNLLCFVGGVVRMIVARNWDAMFAQVMFSVYVLVMSFPVIEGMMFRKDSACVPSSATMKSFMVALLFMSLGYGILLQ